MTAEFARGLEAMCSRRTIHQWSHWLPEKRNPNLIWPLASARQAALVCG